MLYLLISSRNRSWKLTLCQYPPYVTKIRFNHSKNRHVFSPPLFPPLLSSHLPWDINLLLGFNQPVNNLLPSSLTHLTFGESFDLPVDLLPATITHLKFGAEFNHPVDNLQPILQSLELPFNFVHPLDNLPNSISTLLAATSHPIKSLPSSLTHLTLQRMGKMSCPLPSTITHLRIATGDTSIDISSLPLIALVVWDGQLEPNYNYGYVHALDSLPASLTSLEVFSPEFRRPLNHLPSSICRLKIRASEPFTYTLSNLPPSIAHLELAYPFPNVEQLLDLSSLPQIT